jgi:glucose/arabinose dehydrogenase
MVLLITLLWPACVQDIPTLEEREDAVTAVVTAAPPGTMRGRVMVQGGASPQDVVMEVTRVSEQVQAETVVEGLEVPWALAFVPDGRILITERPGRIRVVRDGVLQDAPFATLRVEAVSESGLMGMVLHPEFPINGYVFVCYTYRDGAGRLRNRVARLTDVDGVGTDHHVVLDNIPGARNHDGCALRFGPDSKLYVTMGDAQVADQAQNLDSLSGKVLRLEADGSVPSDNPFSGSYVYSYGHRNPQGLDWHPDNGALYITEHGPDRDDEVNVLEPGGNYGWPQVTGVSQDSRYIDPILAFTPTVAPSGAAFYPGDRLAASWEGNLLFATLKGSHLRRLVLGPPNFRTVLFNERLFFNQLGRLRAVAAGPDGYLYFTTSNRDGRGVPQAGDDKLLRLVPALLGPTSEFHSDAEGRFEVQLTSGTYYLRWALPGFLEVKKRVVMPGDTSIDLGNIVLKPENLTSG